MRGNQNLASRFMRPRVSLRVLLSLVLGSWGAEAVQVGSRCGVGVACRARPLRLSTSEQPVWEGQPTAETDTSAAAGVPIPFRPLDRQEVVVFVWRVVVWGGGGC